MTECMCTQKSKNNPKSLSKVAVCLFMTLFLVTGLYHQSFYKNKELFCG